MKKVLVTGAGGQLGKTLQDTAAEYPDLEPYFLTREELDITDPVKIRQVFQELQPDYCINCAAYTAVDQAEQNPGRAMAINAQGAGNLAEASAAHKVFLIQISTDYVFDGEKEEGYFPEDAPNPINVYGMSKWKGEQEVQKRLPRHLIVRTSWLYSRRYGPNFYLAIVHKAHSGETITVTDKQRGRPTLADHLARYLWDCVVAETPPTGIVHFSDGESMTWHAFAARILKEIGKFDSVRLTRADNYRSFAQRPANSILLP